MPGGFQIVLNLMHLRTGVGTSVVEENADPQRAQRHPPLVRGHNAAAAARPARGEQALGGELAERGAHHPGGDIAFRGQAHHPRQASAPMAFTQALAQVFGGLLDDGEESDGFHESGAADSPV